MRADYSPQISEPEFDSRFHDTITELADREDFPESVTETAVELVIDLPSEVKQHYNPRHMAAASLHIATRQHDTPRTVKQIATQLKAIDDIHVDGHHVQKVQRSVKKLKAHHDLNPNPVLAIDYLPQLIDRLELSETVEAQCRDLLSEIRDRYLACGRSQIAVASAAAYIASQETTDQPLDPGRLAEVACREKKTIKTNAAFFRDELEI